MKFKSYLPYIFIFLLLYVNIIPINLNNSSVTDDSTINQILNLYSLLTSASLNISFFTGIFYIAILFMFIKFIESQH